MADYNSVYTGAEIDQGVGNGLAAPSTYAPIAHDSSATTYGKGTDTKYGHVKLSDATDSTSDTSAGVAATPAAVKAAKEEALGSFVRPNLLDNWYFVGGGSQQNGGQFPINQRSATSYTGTYSIDRWMIGGSATLELSPNCVKLTAATSQNGRSIRQSLERSDLIYGKTITFSVLFGNVTSNAAYIGIMRGSSPNVATVVVEMSDTASSGSLMTVTTTLLSSYDTAPEITFLIGFSNGVASTATAEVIAAKAEIGDTQTLAHQENGTWVLNEIPNYEEQLARCQRFYVKLNNYVRFPLSRVATGEVDFLVPIPVTLRTTPTLSGTLTIYSGSTAQSGFTFTVPGTSPNAISIRGVKTSHGLSSAYLEVNDVSLSAEL